jgi:hypothetical protein
MTPAGSEEQRHYTCQGNWDLLGTLTGAGDVRMVAGVDLNHRPLGYEGNASSQAIP